jgi:hypothetical protein
MRRRRESRLTPRQPPQSGRTTMTDKKAKTPKKPKAVKPKAAKA